MVAPSQQLLMFLEICAVFIGSSLYISKIVYANQPDPYMDEIFHVRQAQAYCDGNFTQWDPKITTLPGLYVISVGMLKPVMQYLGLNHLCGTFWLRLTNVGFAIGNFYLLFELMKKLHQKNKNYDEVKALLTALSLSLFPVLYFFTYLYYTDPGSTFVVLLTYLFHLHGNTALSGLTGALAILFRQTNVVWVVFVAGLEVAEVLREVLHKPQGKGKNSLNGDAVMQICDAASVLFTKLKNQRGFMMDLVYSIVTRTWPYLSVGLGFAAFIYFNGGIVVGDRTAHEACLHFPQFFYFACLALGFGFPALFSLSSVPSFMKHAIQRPLVYSFFLITSVFVVWKFTFAHPYLLADNRHYTFYVWSKIYRRHELVRYALIPCYLFSTYCIFSKLDCKDIWWRTVYSVCLIIATVPQKLLEFRYFILPYLILRLNTSLASYPRLVLELLLYAVVNAATLYLFLHKPFEWEHEQGELQRFIW